MTAAATRRLHPIARGPHTFYITSLTDELRALPETTRTIDGIQVRLCNDGECFFGLASQ